MIAAWMIYTTAVTLLLFAAATGAEYVARALGLATRWVSALAIVATLGLSGRAFIARDRVASQLPVDMATDASAQHVSSVVFGTTMLAAPAAGSASSTRSIDAARPIEHVTQWAHAAQRTVGAVARHLNAEMLDRWDAPLVALWIIASMIAFGRLGASLIGFRRIERRVFPTKIDEHSVLLSSDIGPAIVGVLRSRIVVPEWVLSLPHDDRRMILAHEREHAAAFDPALLYGAAFAVATQPWNPALWALFHRLRLAIETDCDRRVLRRVPNSREYGRLMVAVYERSVVTRAAYMSFVKRPSNLERRIRRMTERPRLQSAGGIAAVLTVAVMSAAACTTPTPSRPVSPDPIITATTVQRPAVDSSASVARPAAAASTGANSASTPPAKAARSAPQSESAQPSATVPPLEMNQSVQPFQLAKRAQSAPMFEFQIEKNAQRATANRGPVHYANPCMFAGRMSGSGLPPAQSLPANGCSIDGEVLVVRLDDTRVLVAARDTADAAVAGVDYMIFTVGARLPANLDWSMPLGHVELVGPDVYVAGPSPDVHGLVFGLEQSEMARRHPDASILRIEEMQTIRQPTVTWDMLRQLSTAPFCEPSGHAPIIIVDGVRQPPSPKRDCFVLSGTPVFLD